MYKPFEIERIGKDLINIVGERAIGHAILDQFKTTHKTWVESLLDKDSEENKRLLKMINKGCEVFVGFAPLSAEELKKKPTERKRQDLIFEIRESQQKGVLKIQCEKRGGGNFMPTKYEFVD